MLDKASYTGKTDEVTQAWDHVGAPACTSLLGGSRSVQNSLAFDFTFAGVKEANLGAGSASTALQNAAEQRT